MDRVKEKPTVYFSNQLEQLAEALGQELFQPGTDPFARKIVFVPHHSLKSYLSSFFARHPRWQISAGVEYKTLLEGVGELLLFDRGEKFPSRLGISFALEEMIYRVLEEEGDRFDKLKVFLGEEDRDKKILWVAEELSSVFYSYGVFEPKALQMWLLEEGWKQELWRRLFSSEGSRRALSDTLVNKKREELPIHLFGFAHIHKHFCKFFCSSRVVFYFLSPSEMFWEDLCTDKERIYLEKKMVGSKVRLQVQEQMQFLLKQTHPILANFGKVGRALLSQIGEMECYLEEVYVHPSSSTTLALLQETLLHLEDGFERRELSLQDTSFLCVSATSKLREVEVLLETLQELMADETIQPKDVLVLSTSLEEYLPYIHMVFGQKTCPFSYSIHGLSSFFSEESKAITFFFSLAESRFDKEAFSQFLSLPSVMKKWSFTPKDLYLFRKWMDKANVLWGLSPEHKKLCLDKSWPKGVFSMPFTEGGTLYEGMEKLIQSLAIDEEGFCIEWTEAELLGRFIHIVCLLQEELRVIYENQKKTLKEWGVLVERWFSLFFDKGGQQESFLHDVYSLQGELGEGSCFPISFESFKRAFFSHFQSKKESFQSSYLNAVKFLSLEIGGAYPSQVIYVLGCDEEALPKKETTSCLDELSRGKETPPLADQNRYLFLELLLHARSSFVLSYERISPKDQKSQAPSRLIQELLEYIDTHFFFKESEKKPSEVFTRHHPAMKFSKRYFLKEAPFSVYSPDVFALAKSYYLHEKRELKPFFLSWQEKRELEDKETLCKEIEVRKLEDFAKNPSRFYLKEVLGVFFPFEPPKDKEFFLPLVTKAWIKKRALLDSLDRGASIAWQRGEVPLGQLGKIGLHDIQEELDHWKEGLSFFGLQEADLVSIEFVEGVRHVEKREGKILVPPLILDVDGVGKVSIHGTLFPTSSKGFVFFGKKSKEGYPLFWPSFLLFLCIAGDLGFEKECLLIEEKKKFAVCPEDPHLWLSRYLVLYFRSLKEPCPVAPDMVSALLFKSKEELQKKMDPSSYDIGYTDPYDAWIMQRDPPVLATYLQTEWKKQWGDAFALFKEDDQEVADVDI